MRVQSVRGVGNCQFASPLCKEECSQRDMLCSRHFEQRIPIGGTTALCLMMSVISLMPYKSSSMYGAGVVSCERSFQFGPSPVTPNRSHPSCLTFFTAVFQVRRTTSPPGALPDPLATTTSVTTGPGLSAAWVWGSLTAMVTATLARLAVLPGLRTPPCCGHLQASGSVRKPQ